MTSSRSRRLSVVVASLLALAISSSSVAGADVGAKGTEITGSGTSFLGGGAFEINVAADRPNATSGTGTADAYIQQGFLHGIATCVVFVRGVGTATGRVAEGSILPADYVGFAIHTSDADGDPNSYDYLDVRLLTYEPGVGDCPQISDVPAFPVLDGDITIKPKKYK